MDSTYPPQATSGLSEYQAINTVLFIVLIVVVLTALINIIRFSKHKPGKHVGPLKAKFIELEKDFRWRRLRVAYLIVSIVLVLFVIGSTYGTDTKALLQTPYAFEVERAKDRMETAIAAIITICLLWGAYFTLLPMLHKFMKSTKDYLKNEKNNQH